MARGGSWNNNPNNDRVANRNGNNPENRNNNLGFRYVVAADVPPSRHYVGLERGFPSIRRGTGLRGGSR
ncbi:MAG: hypothetical protein AUJ92_21530 [Armatimonadetes bacterium CG2_30_59_28]|nr:hypothetical protein [Armatimonadota bacterium]OIO89432.1 MAG: hypothetical protein AUJ92_21530 [Armatimonadetes bacterium CG2_30_59_28]PIX43888.1 MAG: hypothetical protein COZ56_06080 [Armatimonadetes bacterium CG_4_8_14_3_um_filter_58_9]PIY46930.1 MAG: hypothetical protein COZ05_05550 [Armatimonadetes bacterium CG_4_10_14_3_um_filter_59_10]